MTPLDRKIALMRRRRTMTKIAHDLDVSLSHVSQVVAGTRRSPRVEQAVADALGLPVGEVFEPVTDEEPEPIAATA